MIIRCFSHLTWAVSKDNSIPQDITKHNFSLFPGKEASAYLPCRGKSCQQFCSRKLKMDGSAGKSTRGDAFSQSSRQRWHMLGLVVARRQLLLTVFAFTNVSRKSLGKIKIKIRKWQICLLCSEIPEEVQSSVRLNLLFVKNKASWCEGPQWTHAITTLFLN